MLTRLSTSWVMALRSSPQRFFYDSAGRSTHSRGSNPLHTDQTTVDGLPQCLADEVSLRRASVDQIKNRPQGPRKLEALRGLYLALG